MAKIPIDQAAGACSVKILLPLYFLYDISFQNNDNFKKIVKMRCVFCVRIIFQGKGFLIKNGFCGGYRNNIYIVVFVVPVAVFQCKLERHVHMIETAEVAFAVLDVNRGGLTVQSFQHV